MTSKWVMDEMQNADLRDKRLERRLIQLTDTLSEASTARTPAACHDHAEMTAACRFFDNDKVEFENVIQPNIDASYQRVSNQKIALLVQDTTELDFTRPDSQVIGAGPLNHANKQGALLHLLHAFTPAARPWEPFRRKLGRESRKTRHRKPNEAPARSEFRSLPNRLKRRKPFAGCTPLSTLGRLSNIVSRLNA